MLEGVDPLGDDFRHFVEDLLAPPGDRHMEGIVGGGAGRFVVPRLNRRQQRLVRRRKAEIDHHGGAAGQRGAGTGLEIIGRVSAHERHFEMRVRVDPAGHHVTASGIQRLVRAQPLTDLCDLAVLDQHIGLVGAICGDDGAVLDYRAHDVSPLLSRRRFRRFRRRHGTARRRPRSPSLLLCLPPHCATVRRHRGT